MHYSCFLLYRIIKKALRFHFDLFLVFVGDNLNILIIEHNRLVLGARNGVLAFVVKSFKIDISLLHGIVLISVLAL